MILILEFLMYLLNITILCIQKEDSYFYVYKNLLSKTSKPFKYVNIFPWSSFFKHILSIKLNKVPRKDTGVLLCIIFCNGKISPATNFI